MSTTTQSTDAAGDRWAALATMTAPERDDAAHAAIARIASLEPDAQRGEISTILDAEGNLPGEQMAALIGARLRALASLPSDDARRLLALFEAAAQQQPAAVGMKRVVAQQSACKSLTPEDMGRVEAFLPRVRQMAGLEGEQPRRAIPARNGAPSAAGPRRPFWRRFTRS